MPTFRLTRRAALWSAAGLTLSSAAPWSKISSVAFRYSAVFTAAEIEWYSRFHLLVTGGILAADQTSRLLAAGCRLIAYEWAPAFYPGDSVSTPLDWQERVRVRQRDWLISPSPEGGGAAAPGKTAFWYDLADPSLRAARATHLAAAISSNGYSGVFLDTPGFEQLPESMRRAFNARHPGLDYNEQQGRFFEKLREALGPSRVLFLNQGYRHAAEFLPHADYDLTESYFTAQSGSGTVFRPWHNPQAPWESIRTPLEQLVIPASLRFPKVRFVHLGYAGSSPSEIRRAIHYGYAAAKLWNHDSYLMSASSSDEVDSIYERSLGRPLTASYQESTTGDAAWRHFEHGIVALNSSSRRIHLSELGRELPPGPAGFILPH